MREKRIPMSNLFMFLTTALFLASFLILTFIGANVYRNVVSIQKENGDKRAVSSYLSAAFEQCDKETLVLSEKAENQMLVVIPDAGTSYARKLYILDGQLVEEYAKTEAPLSAKNAMVIGETKTLLVEEVKDGLFLLTTDYGKMYVSSDRKGGLE